MDTKKITWLFSAGVLGVAVCLVMTVYTAVNLQNQKSNTPVSDIPVPAVVE